MFYALMTAAIVGIAVYETLTHFTILRPWQKDHS